MWIVLISVFLFLFATVRNARIDRANRHDQTKVNSNEAKSCPVQIDQA